MTQKEITFANNYLCTFNATAAAKAAGYSEHTARQQGSRLLTNVDIEKYIQSKSSQILESICVTQKRVLREIAAIAFSNVADFLNDDWSLKPLNEIPRDKIGAIDIRTTVGILIKGKKKTLSTNMNTKLKALTILWDLVKEERKLK